ncbi:MAG: YDG domain-containing protein, partial [Angelakisella sp.]
GSGNYGFSGTVAITGGTVTATGGYLGAGIGSGYKCKRGIVVTINGDAFVSATKGSENASHIGAGESGLYATVSRNKGIIFEGLAGRLWGGDVTLPASETLPSGSNLVLDPTQTLIIPEGITLDNNGTLYLEGGTINGAGTLAGNGTFKAIVEAEDIAAIPDQLYTGRAIEPELKINSSRSIMGKDFTVVTEGFSKEYKDNVSRGKASVVLYKRLTEGTYKVTTYFNIIKSGTEFENGIKIYNASGTETTSFTYGDEITVKVKPKATGKEVRSAIGENQMALYLGETQLCEPVGADAGGTYTMVYNTVDKRLLPGTNTVTAKYGGNVGMEAYAEDATITVNPKPVTAKAVGAIKKAYDGTNTAQITLELAKADMIGTDAVTVTAPNAVYVSKDAGFSYIDCGTLSVTGTGANYYAVSVPVIGGKIIPAILYEDGGTVVPKKWDGTTNATVTELVFKGLVNGETLSIGKDYDASGLSYESADVGLEKQVTGFVQPGGSEKIRNYHLHPWCRITGDILPADGPTAPEFESMDDEKNTFSFKSEATVLYEYSTDSGSTWIDVTPANSVTVLYIGNIAVPVGALQVRAKATATHEAGQILKNDSPFTAKIAGMVAVNEAFPAYGDELTTAVYIVQPGAELHYQWKADGVDIPGATQTTYKAQGADVGKILTVEVTATGYEGSLSDSTSAAVDKKAVAAQIDKAVSKVYDGNTAAPISLSVAEDQKVAPQDELIITAPGATFDNKNVGTGKKLSLGALTVSGAAANLYTVSAPPEITGEITAKALTDGMVSGIKSSYAYTGSAIAPVPTVADGAILTPNDYTVSYKNNKDTGTATVTVTGKENYSGTVNQDFTIAPAIPGISLTAQVEKDAKDALLTATVYKVNEGTVPTGTVKFVDTTDGTAKDIPGAEAVALVNGVAVFNWKNLSEQEYKVKAVYSGEGNYSGAESSETAVRIGREIQEKLFVTNPGQKTYGDNEFVLETTGGSGSGGVSFTSSAPGVLRIDTNKAVICGAGQVTITATKAGDNKYSAATAELILTLGKATPVISWKAAAQTCTYTGDTAVITAPEVSLVKGESFTGVIRYAYKEKAGLKNLFGLFTEYTEGLPVNAGSYEVRASVTEADNYKAAETTVNLMLTVAKAPTTVKLKGYADQVYTGLAVKNPTEENVTVTGATYRDVSFTYYVDDGGKPGAAINGAPSKAGSYWIQAHIAETANTSGSESDAVGFRITKAPLSVIGGTVTPKKWDGTSSAKVTGLKVTGLVKGEILEEGTDYTSGSPVYDSPDVGNKKRVSGTAVLTENEKTRNYSLQGNYILTGAITAADGPQAPEFVSMDDTLGVDSYTFKSTSGVLYEYKIGQGIWREIKAAGETTTITVGNIAVEIGGLQVRAKATATHEAGKILTNAAPFTVSIDGGLFLNIGDPVYGETLTTSLYEVPEGTVLHYKWESDNENILGAADSSYKLRGTDVGTTVSVEVTADGYAGSLRVSTDTTIGKKPVTAQIDKAVSKVYDGNTAAEVRLSVADSDKGDSQDEILVTASGEYENKNVGKDKAITLGELSLTGSAAGWYDVTPPAAVKGNITVKSLTDSMVSGIETSYEYTGSAITPVPTVTDGASLTPNDYTVSYENNTETGVATVTVTGKGNYFGTGTKKFNITKAKGTITITGDPGKVYDGTCVADPSVEKNSPDGEVSFVWYRGEDRLVEAPTEAGSYRVVAVMTAGHNYTEAEATKAFAIQKAPGAITVSSDPGKSYDGTAVGEPQVEKNGSDGRVTFAWYEGKTKLESAPIEVGSYTVKAMMEEGSNHTPAEGTREFAIKKAAAPQIDYPTAAALHYGERLSSSPLTGGSTEYGSFAWEDGQTVPEVTNNGYPVLFTPSEATKKNYESITDTRREVAVTVEKSSPAVQLSATVTRTSDSRQATLTVTASKTGAGEIPSGTVTFVDITDGTEKEIPGAEAITLADGVATYTWTGLDQQIYRVKARYSGSDNYSAVETEEIEFDTRKQNQEALSIDNPGEKTYGDESFVLKTTGGSGTGLISYTSSDSGVLSIEGSTATIHSAGDVTITVTKAGDETYNPATAAMSLMVQKKKLCFEAEDALEIPRGSAMPKLGYKPVKLAAGDSIVTEPQLATTAKDTETVGEFDITIKGAAVTNPDSYAISYKNGRMTVVEQYYRVTVTDGSGSGLYEAGKTVEITAAEKP